MGNEYTIEGTLVEWINAQLQAGRMTINDIPTLRRQCNSTTNEEIIAEMEAILAAREAQ